MSLIKSMSNISEIKDSEKILPIIIGRDSFNNVKIIDLFRLPNLLIAGTSGQGKTVCLNSIITSLLCKKQSSELKFVLIDPKIIELSSYNKLNKSFIAQLEGEDNSVITDYDTAKRTLDSLKEEMDNRYLLLHEANARSIVEYNDKFARSLISSERGQSPMPYIVIAIDEFADLLFMSEGEIERPLWIISTLGRAVGIHLVLTTMRLSEEVVTGRFKANCPARIAFRMHNGTDSLKIIDCKDAAYLSSPGDMLFSYSGSIDRLKGTFIETQEIESIIESINNNQMDSNPYILPQID